VRQKAIRESVVEKVCSEELRKEGCLVVKFASPVSRGWPDRLIIPKDKPMFFIEFKRPGGKTTRLQEVIHERIRGQGARVYVVDSLAVLDDVISAELT